MNSDEINGVMYAVGSVCCADFLTLDAFTTRPVANDDNYDTDEDTGLTVAAPGVLGNDSDAADGGGLTAEHVSGPANGSLTLAADGAFSYVPNANFHGTDSFKYRARDADGAVSAPATVTITVLSINDPPVANDDSYSTDEDTGLTVAAPGVLGNDNDAADGGGGLTAELVSGPASGSLAFNADGSFSYAPNANFHGTDIFTYRARDADGAVAAATVTITVLSINDPPVVANDTATTTQGTAVSIAVLSNDTDVDGDSLSVASVTNGANGQVVINPDGTVTYTPSTNFLGGDSFSYTATDGRGGSATASVTVTVTTKSGFAPPKPPTPQPAGKPPGKP